MNGRRSRFTFAAGDHGHRVVVYERRGARVEVAARRRTLAGLPKQSGSLWHAYRRGWATSRKHLPDVDVAAAGGWKSTETLRRCYQQPDDASVRRVVLEPVELREQQA